MGLILIVLMAGCTEPTEPPITPPDQNQPDQNTPINPTDQNQPLDSRGFLMGTVPIPPQPLTNEGWINTFALLSDNAEIVLHHSAIDWNKFIENSISPRSADKTPNLEQTNFIALMAKQNNLKTFIVIDPLQSNREELDAKAFGQAGLKFEDRSVPQAFRNYAVRIAQDYKPAYMGIGSEVNTYMLNHPQDTQFLTYTLRDIISEVKRESPNTIVTATFQYESLVGKADGQSQWNLLSQVEPYVDAVSITTYPSLFFETPDQIPADYYAQLKEHTQKPIISAESGWPSGGDAQYHGSPENQKRFVERLPQLTKDLSPKLWIWWFLHDWSGEGYPDFFKTMGLRTSTGEEKPVWTAWQQIQKAPVQ